MGGRCFLILLCVNFNYGLQLMDDEPTEVLTWPTEFHLKAEKLNLKSGIVEPQELWSRKKYGRSRIDYYGGDVKKYYYWGIPKHPAYVINVHYVTTEDLQNSIVCQRRTRKSEFTKLLPSTKNLEYAGVKNFEGQLVQVWRTNTQYEKESLQKITLYTYIDNGFNIPVQRVFKKFSRNKGSLRWYSITNYYDYNSTVAEDDVDDQKIEDCEDAITLSKDFRADVKHLHPGDNTDVDLGFHSFVKHHGKNYDSEDEHEMRKTIFQQNWEMINHHNRQNLGYKLELNQFADLTDDEMNGYMGLLPRDHVVGTHPFPHTDEEIADLADEIPENYDMRMEGSISVVKNQADCGSCWAFAAAAAVEGALARSNEGRILDLSEQSLVDCSWGFWNDGCFGGHTALAFEYLIEHGIPLEEEYGPYLEQNGICHLDNMTTLFPIRGYTVVPSHCPEALRVALYKYGPTVVSIHSSTKMRFYSGGVFFDIDCNKGPKNHAVTVVGYGVRDGDPYWIIKNSYGEDWGQAGYILLSAIENNCFVLDQPVYPVV